MDVRFAKHYVEQAFEVHDLDRIYHLIGLVDKEPKLPEELWLFNRIYEWAPARSGVWQYYEELPDAMFQRIASALEKFGLNEVAAKYREGQRTWNGPTRADELDRWLNEHYQAIHAAAFKLAESRKDYLNRCGAE